MKLSTKFWDFYSMVDNNSKDNMQNLKPLLKNERVFAYKREDGEIVVEFLLKRDNNQNVR